MWIIQTYKGKLSIQQKIDSAKEKLEKINPDIKINVYNEKLTAKNAVEIIKNYDIIIDGTDNIPSRYLINDACVLLKKPNIYGSIYRFEGQVTVFSPAGPCYRCLHPKAPANGLILSCEEGGVVGILPGIIGSIQATEAVKLIIGKGKPLIGRLLVFDGLEMKFTELKVRKNNLCETCGRNVKITQIKEIKDYDGFCESKIEVSEIEEDSITAEELKLLLETEKIKLIDVREKEEWKICHIEGAELVPPARIPKKANKLNKNDFIVLYCHLGPRSEWAMRVLKQTGFKNVKFLKGGIDAWAERIDYKMIRY